MANKPQRDHRRPAIAAESERRAEEPVAIGWAKGETTASNLLKSALIESR